MTGISYSMATYVKPAGNLYRWFPMLLFVSKRILCPRKINMSAALILSRFESCSLNWSPPQRWSSGGNRRLSRAEFLARTPPKGSQSKLWNRHKKSAAWLDSPVKGNSWPVSGLVIIIVKYPRQYLSVFLVYNVTNIK